MKYKLSPIFLVITAALSLPAKSYAEPGSKGADGESFANGSTISLQGGLSQGNVGLADYELLGLSNGGNGGVISGREVIFNGASAEVPTIVTGEPGVSGQLGVGGGGSGGDGGGVVAGGISRGGAGGNAKYGNPAEGQTYSADGGSGGLVENNSVVLTNVTIIGGDGGDGGHSLYGGGGDGGFGGGSVFGGISGGAAGGRSVIFYAAYEEYLPTPTVPPSANGGSGGAVSNHRVTLSNVSLEGGLGGAGGGEALFGSGGDGGHGGGSVYGGMSSGGVGGNAPRLPLPMLHAAEGGSGGDVFENVLRLSDIRLKGGAGGLGGSGDGDGMGGDGGGSVFGGVSSGGSGGDVGLDTSSLDLTGTESFTASGGRGGNVFSNRVELSRAILNGADAGAGGQENYDGGGGGGAGGHGGGSVFGGVSRGGAAGELSGGNSYSGISATGRNEGGAGGNVYKNAVVLKNVELYGGLGGSGGGNTAGSGVVGDGVSGGGAGGNGGASIYGGFSSGAAGGYSADTAALSSSVEGGAGGSVYDNTVSLFDTVLSGAAGGLGGEATGGRGLDGYMGGSVFGGWSSGGAGGLLDYSAGNLNDSASGGAGGDVTNNKVMIAGLSRISGDVYGGYSHGGSAGTISPSTAGNVGVGGQASHNTVTLVGEQITIGTWVGDTLTSGGAIYGGRSINGDGKENVDPTFTSFYQGNTLNLQGYRGAVSGIHNFQNYNWVLPKSVVNESNVVSIAGSSKVNLDHTIHTIAMESDGNILHAGDSVILIDKAEGVPLQTPSQVEQGSFIVYDVTTEVEGDQFVLKINDENFTSTPDPEPDGRLNPKSKAFLMGRLPMLAITNQGADMMGGAGLDAARSGLGHCGTSSFVVSDGGDSRYDTGSHIKVQDFRIAAGAGKCFEFSNQSTAMAGAFFEYGKGNFDSFNDFGEGARVRGRGNLHYTGLGLMAHINVANTGSGKQADAPSISDKDGLYFNTVLRGGNVKSSFDTGLVSAEGVAGRYNSRSRYASIMVGTGYAWIIDDKQTLDVYGRYAWNRVNADDVSIGNEHLSFGSMNSSRVRLGGQYSYELTPQMKPYLGLAFEHEFKGAASGSVYGMSIDQPTLKGSTGIAELGLEIKPSAVNQAWTVNASILGYAGEREGFSGGLSVKYLF